MPTREERIAEAVASTGSSEYSTRSGPTLTLMAEFGREGDLIGISMAYRTYTTLFPRDARRLTKRIPPIILNQYFCLHHQISQIALIAWPKRSPDWEEAVAGAIGNDHRFDWVVRAMAEAIKRSEGS